jgi:hypothetical protein
VGPRVAAADREVAEYDADVQRVELNLGGGAERALVITVDDDQPRPLGPADVVVGADRRQRGGAEVGQSASKMRFAPGSSLSCGAW